MVRKVKNIDVSTKMFLCGHAEPVQESVSLQSMHYRCQSVSELENMVLNGRDNCRKWSYSIFNRRALTPKYQRTLFPLKNGQLLTKGTRKQPWVLSSLGYWEPEFRMVNLPCLLWITFQQNFKSQKFWGIETTWWYGKNTGFGIREPWGWILALLISWISKGKVLHFIIFPFSIKQGIILPFQ